MISARRLRTTLGLREVEAAAELAAGASLEAILEGHLRAIEAALRGGMLTSILLLDAERRRLLHGAAPNLPKAFCDAIHGSEIGPAAGTCGTAAYLNQPVYVTDIATDPLWDDYRHLALPHGLRACWSTPINDARGQVLGTFAVYHLTPRRPTEEELAAVRLIADHVAAAITTSMAPTPVKDVDAAADRDRSAEDPGAAVEPLSSPRAMDPQLLWERMQQIERCRHRAEMAEIRSAEAAPALRREMTEIALQWRQLALEYELLFKRGL